MRKTTFLAFFLFCFLSNPGLSQAVPRQTPLRTVVPKAVFKEGRFFFYNSSFTADSTKLAEKRQTISLTPPCFKCAATQSVKKSTITSGQIILYITTQDATCGYGSGSIMIEAANGTAPYTYSVDGFSSSNGYFPVEGSGAHSVVVTDATGTSTTTTVTLTDIFPGPVLIPYNILSYPSTCSLSDGSVQMNPIGGTPPYQYSLDLVNFQTSNVFSNLYSGVYSLYAKDANGCIGFGTVFLLNRQCDGMGGSWGGFVCGNSANVSIADNNQLHNGPFLYSMDGINYQNTGDFPNIGVGVHQFYIKDNSGKVQIIGFNEAENCHITIQYIAVSAACMQNDGSMTVTASNGKAPYQYTIDGVNYQGSNVFNGLAPGNYFITVMDADGVKTSLPAAVYDRCPVVRAVSTAETCANNDGTITAAGFKGTTPYLYSLDGTNFQTNNSFSGLVAGNYTVTIKDALGFTSNTAIVIYHDCLSATAVGGSSVCGKSNGSITVNAANGTAPYQYSLDGIVFQTPNVFSNQLAGAYLVRVKDANSVMVSANITITDIPGPVVNASATAASCLNNDGIIDITASGGTLPFQYSKDGINFQGSSSFTGLDTGSKLIMVKDGNGCTAAMPITVPLTNDLFVDAGTDVTVCQGKPAQLNAVSNGNVLLWQPAMRLTNTSILNPVASPDNTTKYFLKSVSGVCTKTDSVLVIINPAPTADAGPNMSTCYGKTIQLQGAGGLNYTWFPDTNLDNPAISNPSVIKPTETATYHLNVTDANNCQSLQPASVTITVVPAPKVFAGNDTSIIKNHSLPLNVIDVNNSGFTSFVWTPSSGLNDPYSKDPVAYITDDISYTVTASTADGCEGVGTISVKVFSICDIYVPNAFTPNGDGHNDQLRAIPVGIKEFIKFEVFNRWGQLVFSTRNAGAGWDGTIGGQPQHTGTFVWLAEGIGYNGIHIQRSGTAVLIR
jgi:gliding motility-associated-like protein